MENKEGVGKYGVKRWVAEEVDDVERRRNV